MYITVLPVCHSDTYLDSPDYGSMTLCRPGKVGLAPWHLDNRHAAGCNIATKAKCSNCDMKLGAESFPRLLAEASSQAIIQLILVGLN